MATQADEFLVRTLATVDAMFTPFRHGQHGDCRVAGVQWERRREYRLAGVSIPSGGNEAERKNRSRMLQSLQWDGLLRTTGNTRGAMVKLTQAGEERARALAGVPQLWDSFPLLQLINLRLNELGRVLEFDLIDLYPPEAKSEDVCRLEDLAQPLLTEGWLDSNSDVHGHVGYILTPEGREALAEGPPDKPENLPEFDQDCRGIHSATHIAVYRERLTWKAKLVGNLSLALSAGQWEPPPNRKGVTAARRKVKALLETVWD